MYVCMYACMYVCMHACMHACIYVRMYVCMYVWMDGWMRVYVFDSSCEADATTSSSVVSGVMYLCGMEARC